MSNFTPRAQQVLALARKEADRFNHNYIGTEHVLLGLIKLGQGVAVSVLQRMGLDLESVRMEVEKEVGTGPDQKKSSNIPYTPRVKKVLSLANKEATPKRTNVHIARQALRLALLEQLGGRDAVQWGHKLVDFKDTAAGVELNFQVMGEVRKAQADLVVGADGIRSAVRQTLFDKETAPLRYLGCMVILGICPLQALQGFEHDLLDSATVFQTANGNDRIYIMPYSADTVMWQLSFPMAEDEAKTLAAQGPQALKAESCRRTQWHEPIPQILAATEAALVSGYPVYDRALLAPQRLAEAGKVTLIGDAAHPMSPFKGQGANQALLDALALARAITKGCGPYTSWRETGIRDSVLTEFEAEMLARSGVKVKGSAEAAEFLHSETVLHEGNEPRGRCLSRK